MWGIEHQTFRMQNRRSTTELHPLFTPLLLLLTFVTHSVTINLLLQKVGDVGDRTPALLHATRTLYH